MKAMVMKDFGGPDVFELRQVDRPEPRPDEVLVKVYATSVNPVDYKIRQSGSGIVTPPAIIGYDVAGVIEKIGTAVYDYSIGDEVFYTPEIFAGQGSYAQYHVVKAAIAAKKPVNLSFEEAASIPLAGGTAWDALMTRAQIRVGETVLIHGTGGVGSHAIQIARAAGTQVFVVCSDYMLDTARELGAYQAIDYHADNFADIVLKGTDGFGVDVVLDTVGGDVLARSIAVTKPYGRMVGIVEDIQGSLDPAFIKNITLHLMFLERARYKLDALRVLAERGQLKPVIDSVLPLEQAAEAHRRLEQGGVKGKLVLKVAE